MAFLCLAKRRARLMGSLKQFETEVLPYLLHKPDLIHKWASTSRRFNHTTPPPPSQLHHLTIPGRSDPALGASLLPCAFLWQPCQTEKQTEIPEVDPKTLVLFAERTTVHRTLRGEAQVCIKVKAVNSVGEARSDTQLPCPAAQLAPP